MTQPEIATLTINPCLDLSAETEVVEPTKKLRCRKVRRDPGGGGVNVSRAISILGGTSHAVFPCGGSTGEAIVRMLDEQGVDSSTIYIDSPNRESFAVRETNTNRQYRFALPGPRLEERDWGRCLEELGSLDPQPSYIVASGSLPPGVPEDFYGRLADRFRDTSTRVVVDTSGEPLRLALQQSLFLIKPNRRELEEICNCSLADDKTQRSRCRRFVDEGNCEVLVLTLGAAGALLTTRDTQLRLEGLEVEEVSAVGAGDSFVGAMVLALQQGRSLEDAFIYGMAAGSAALTTDATELCSKEETESFYEKLQQRRRG